MKVQVQADAQHYHKGGGTGQTKEVERSTADPECSMFHKGEHERCFAYTAYTACDRHNFIPGVELSPANVHSVMFKSIYDKVKTAFPEYKSKPELCAHCFKRECTQSKSCQKTVIRHVWADYLDIAEDFCYTPQGKVVSRERSETIDRAFADAKEKHGLRYTTLRGKAKVTMQALLTFASVVRKILCKAQSQGNLKSDSDLNPVAEINHEMI